MSAEFSPSYSVRWKGRVSGPYDKETVLDMLRTKEISLMHEVQLDGQWVSIKSLIELWKQADERESAHRRQAEEENQRILKEQQEQEFRRQEQAAYAASQEPRRIELPPLPAPTAPNPVVHQHVFAQPYGYGGAPQLKTSGLAITGMIMGILSLIPYGFIFGILGVIFSAIALSQIKKQPTVLQGRGMAIAGLVMSLISMGFYLVVILAFAGALASCASCAATAPTY